MAKCRNDADLKPAELFLTDWGQWLAAHEDLREARLLYEGEYAAFFANDFPLEEDQ